MVRISADENQPEWIREAKEQEEKDKILPEVKGAEDTEAVLEIKDYYRMWVKSPENVPGDRSARYDREGDPAGNHYYYEVPFDTKTRIDINGDIDKAISKGMQSKAEKEYPDRTDLLDIGVPEKDLNLVDKVKSQLDSGDPLFGQTIRKTNQAILRDIDSALTLLHLYKIAYDSGSGYESFLNQIQKELGRRGVYGFEKISKARRYIDAPADAPEGMTVHEGERGGLYYETDENIGETNNGQTTDGELPEITFDDWPEQHMELSIDQARTYTQDYLFDRTDPQVAQDVLTHAGNMRDKSPNSLYDSDTQEVVIGPSAMEEQIAHEYGHALADTYGYSIEKFGHGLTNLYGGVAPTPIRFGEPVVDVFEDIAQHAVDEGNLDPASGEQVLELVYDEFGERELKKEDLMLTNDNQAGSPVDGLVQEVNSAWERQIEAAQSNEEDLNDYAIVAPYSSLNADETLAMTHEALQGDVARPDTLENLYRRHDPLLQRYLEVFEPGRNQKAMLNHLFESFGPNAAFDDFPFPEAEGALQE